MNSRISQTSLITSLKDLVKSKYFLYILFFGILFLDALGIVFPKYFNRHVTIFVPLPLILIIYLISARKKSILFVASIICNVLGIYYFNGADGKSKGIGIIFHAVAFCIYFVILFRHYIIFSIHQILKVSILVAGIAAVPLIAFSEGLKEMFLFNEINVYAISTSLYMISALLLFLNDRKTYRFLFLSFFAILISSYFQGYNLFISSSIIVMLFANISFSLTHFFVCAFLLENQKRVQIKNEKAP